MVISSMLLHALLAEQARFQTLWKESAGNGSRDYQLMYSTVSRAIAVYGSSGSRRVVAWCMSLVDQAVTTQTPDDDLDTCAEAASLVLELVERHCGE